MSIPYAEVIGDPIGHSKSPLIHKFWLEKLGLDYDFRRTQVPKSALSGFLKQRRKDAHWCGCNVTIPHKVAVVGLMDEVSGFARTVGAVNCITRVGAREPLLIGQNTDVGGFLEPLRPWLYETHKMRLAYVIGTGGAAAAVSVALDRQGFTIVSIGRDVEKALALRHRLQLFDDDLAVHLAPYALPGSPDWGDRTDALYLLVNATPLGMTGYPELAFDLDFLPPETIVYDLVYAPLETLLLKGAAERGLAVIRGLEMLVAQAAAAFELFFAEKAPREHDAELLELLTQ